MKHIISKALFILAVGFGANVLVPSIGATAPVVSGISGGISHGSSVTISGTGFGVKSPAKPYLWAPFDNSAKPSSLGITSAWSYLKDMAYTASEGVGGTGGLKATNSSGSWLAGIDASGFAWNDYGQQMYLFRKVKQNFDIGTINWKLWRVWPSGTNYPNIYLASNNGRLYVEDIGAGAWGNATKMQGSTNVWKTEELTMQAESGGGQTDGYFQFSVNGVPALTDNDLYLRNGTRNSAMVRNYVVHGQKANITFPDNYRYWADDVYLDTSWARVMIGNASTWANSNNKEIQIPSSWSDSKIEVHINTGTFANYQQAYLYVVDTNGNVNSNGYPIVIGETGSMTPPANPPAAPKNLRIQQ